MLERFGIAVVEERRHDPRFAALEDYLRKEYGSTSGMGRYIAGANHTSPLRSGLRTLLAKIARAFTRPRTRVVTSAVSVEQALGDDCAEHVTPVAQATPVAGTRPIGYRVRSNARSKVRPRTVLPPLKR